MTKYSHGWQQLKEMGRVISFAPELALKGAFCHFRALCCL